MLENLLEEEGLAGQVGPALRILVGWRNVSMIVLLYWMVQFERCLESEVGSICEYKSSLLEITVELRADLSRVVC